MKISPSILAATIVDLKRVLEQMDPARVDFVHMDIMDGHFVPQLSFGEQITKEVSALTSIPLDVHLMCDRPELEVPKYFALKPHNITFHLEASHFPIRLAQSIRERGIKAGIALCPGTPIENLEPALDYIDQILIMSVEPGFYGQKFLTSTYRKLERTRELIMGRDIILEVDGGVNTENISRLKDSGVDMCVAGSACFKSGDVNENVMALKTAAGVSPVV